MPFHENIMKVTKENNNFRNVIATAGHSQIVLMSLIPGQDVGLETHTDMDQILVFVEGEGQASINGEKSPIAVGDLFLIPAGTQHNFTNTGKTALKFFTMYAPTEFKQGMIQKDKPAQ